MNIDQIRLKQLFQEAIIITDRAERDAWLTKACGADADLLANLQMLLIARDDPASFLDRLAPPDTSSTDVTGAFTPNQPRLPTVPLPASHERPGHLVGRYKLLECLGEGGMGSVWMAEQREPVKRVVAIKLIKAGMDSQAVLARFEAERQALALMDHPNIAKVLDGGTTESGRPYFVMELVKGLSLTEYCDSRRLNVKDRLQLFIQICAAVQHAHQKGIIHRDLKPTNVLVTEHDGVPVPKVIDFGLAKALSATNLLTDRTLHTAYGTVVGTPLYMAPEQVGINALDTDTRSDIYALGVILYELLTGTTPLEKQRFKEAAWEEVKRIIQNEDPPRPSLRLSSSNALPSLAAQRQIEPGKLSSMVKGELDWIVMKALDKDRNRRYETANGVAADVTRYLSGEPVQAHPPTWWYRYRKFSNKHRGSIFAGYMLLAGVVLFTGSLYTQVQRAREAEHRANEARVAEAQRADGEQKAKLKAEDEMQKARKQNEVAEAVREFLEQDLIAQADPLQAGNNDFKPDVELKLKTALDRAATRIAKRFEGKPLIEASIRRAIGKAYLGRGLTSEALTQVEKASELYRSQLTPANETDVEGVVVGPYIETQMELANLYAMRQQEQKSVVTLKALEDQVRRSYGNSPEGKGILNSVAYMRELYEEKDPVKARTKSQAMLDIMFDPKLLDAIDESPEMKDVRQTIKSTFQPMTQFFAAKKLADQGKFEEAEKSMIQLIASQPETDSTVTLPFLLALADIYHQQGKNIEAKATYIRARGGIKKVYGEDHFLLAACRQGLAKLLLSEKQFADAEVEIRAMQIIYDKFMPNSPITTETQSMLGIALLGQKKYTEAEPQLLAAFEGYQKQQKTTPEVGKTLLPVTVTRLIELYTAMNKPEEVKKWQGVKGALK